MLKLLAILALLLGGGYFAARGAMPTSATPTPIAAAPAASPTPSPGDTVVTMDEGQIADALNANLAGKPLGETPLGPATASNFAVQLRNGQFMVTGNAQVAGASAPVSLTGTVVAQDEKPVVSVSDASVGGVPLPDATRQRIQGSLQTQVDQLVASRGVRLHSVSISDGRLTLAGTRG